MSMIMIMILMTILRRFGAYSTVRYFLLNTESRSKLALSRVFPIALQTTTLLRTTLEVSFSSSSVNTMLTLAILYA